jgi:hypothetical protein
MGHPDAKVFRRGFLAVAVVIAANTGSFDSRDFAIAKFRFAQDDNGRGRVMVQAS